MLDWATAASKRVARGRYLEQLERVWAHVPRSQRALFSDHLDRDPAATLVRSTTSWACRRTRPPPRSAGTSSPLVGAAHGTRERLEAQFAEPDQRLAEALGTEILARDACRDTVHGTARPGRGRAPRSGAPGRAGMGPTCPPWPGAAC